MGVWLCMLYEASLAPLTLRRCENSSMRKFDENNCADNNIEAKSKLWSLICFRLQSEAVQDVCVVTAKSFHLAFCVEAVVSAYTGEPIGKHL